MEKQPGTAPADELDLVVDLSDGSMGTPGLARHLAALRAELAGEGRRITLIPPAAAKAGAFSGVSVPGGPPAEALATALAAAARRRRGLAVVRGAWLPGNAAIAALSVLSRLDPMIGSAQPRFSLPDDDSVLALPGARQAQRATLPPAALPFLPPTFLTPELPAALLLLSPRGVLAADAPRDGAFGAALAVLLMGLRRRGFRNLVANRVVVPFPLDPALAYPPPALSPDGETEHPWQPEAVRVRDWLATLPERALEFVLAGAFAPNGRARLLLDCRGLVEWHNGTSQATLGLLEGFAGLRLAGLEITLLASTAAAQFHRLATRYPDFGLQLDRPEGSYLAAILLNQPWSVDRIVELHRCAVLILFNMLDTIAWDIIGPAPAALDQAWRLMARLADGLLFDSFFTRDRFVFRFAPDPAIPLVVTHLSLSLDDLVREPVGKRPFAEPYLLVFGNSYDHKDVDPTLARLVDGFPYARIVALGAESVASPRVTLLRSGYLDEAEINTLIAHAAAVVYPSFYEGFGLPVVMGLARGRTVIVRRSALWEEIAEHSDLPGAIVPFDDECGLIEAAGRALHGLPAQGLARGGALAPGTGAPSWRDCAGRIGGLVQRLAFAGDGRRWLDREMVLRYRTELEDQR